MFWSGFLTKGKPLVSVIIPTKNSEATIGKCLQSIKDQTYSKIQVIVVDNYSSDETCEIAEKFGAKVYLSGPERAPQKNMGVNVAKGKYVYGVDSDSFVEPTVIEECTRKCEEEGFDAIAVHNTSDPTISFWSKVRKLERDCYRDDKMNVAARFLRKDVFEEIGGFDDSLVAGEDYDLQNRLLKAGWKVGTIEAQEVHVGEPKSLLEVAKKHYYYGKTIWRYIGKNPKRAGIQFSPIRLGYLRHWGEFSRHPSLFVGFAVYQLVRYSATAIGCLTLKLERQE